MDHRLPSLDLNQAEREQQLAHFDDLDTKAGIVLGFAGVLIALESSMSSPWNIAGLAAGLVSAALAVAAFWPRRYPTLLPSRLRTYLTSEESFTKLRLLDTTAMMIDDTSRVLAVKAQRLKIALGALGFAATAHAVATIAA